MFGFRDFFETARDYLPDLLARIERMPDDVLVHFGGHDKVGISTKPSHSDPVGVYAFPKKYVLSPAFNRNSHFFGKPYVFILKLKPGARVLNLSTLTDAQVDAMIDRMGIAAYKDVEDPRDRKSGGPGHRLWDTIEHSQQDLSGRRKNINWNRLFRLAGDYDVLLDDGSAIIHNNEPSQVVILNPRAYEVYEKIRQEPAQIYQDLAVRIVRMLADAVFDGPARLTTGGEKMYGSKDRRVAAEGEAGGRPLLVSLKYHLSDEMRKSVYRSLRGTVFLSSPLSRGYRNFDVQVELDDDNNLDAWVKSTAAAIRQWASVGENFRPEQSDVVRELAQAVLRTLGLGGSPQGRGESLSYRKVYPRIGTLTVLVSYLGGYSKMFQVAVNLENKGGFGRGQIYGRAELDPAAVRADVAGQARRAVETCLKQWDDTIEWHYNPDESKHDDWDRANGFSWGRAQLGSKMLSFLSFLRSKL